MTLAKKLTQIKSGKLKAVDNVLNFSKKIATQEVKDLNIFLHLNENAIEQAKKIDERIKQKKDVGKLAGLCFAVKSNICVQGLVCNCASKVLENFVAPFNAQVINNLLAEDAIILGMVNMDEFASGSSGETSAFGPTKNPLDKKLIAGGSSSGSASAVAADLCDFSLGSDTGGSIRNPASHCSVVGFKPTYGSVSRYGLIDLSMSLDQIGTLTKNSEDSKLIFDVIKGEDNFDTTTKKESLKEKPKKTIGLVNVKDCCDEKITELVKQKTEEFAKKNNYKIKSINLPLEIAMETYYILNYTEFFSATRKFDGRRFGLKIEDAAGPEVLRRIFGGSEVTKAEHEGRFYNSAKKAKEFLKQEFEKIFQEVDLIILPTVPKLPHKIGEKISTKEMYNYDILTIPANLAELPAISIPVGKIENKPIGLQILTKKFNEKNLFEVAKKFE